MQRPFCKTNHGDIVLRIKQVSSTKCMTFLRDAQNLPGPHFVALLIIGKESAVAVAENSVLAVCVFHGLARNFSFCACVFCITKDSVLNA